MLARQRAAELHDRSKASPRRPLDLVQHIAIPQVEQDVGMQVAIASVKDIGDRQLIMLADFPDRRKHLRQLGSRYDTVVQVIIGPDPPEGSDGALATRPEEVALGRSLRLAQRVALVLRQAGCAPRP